MRDRPVMTIAVQSNIDQLPKVSFLQHVVALTEV